MGNQETCFFVNFSNGLTVSVVFQFDGWSTKAAIVLVVVSGIVSKSSVMTGWVSDIVLLEVVLTCIVKCEKCMRPWVVSMTTLLFLLKCNLNKGPVNYFITTKCSVKTFSPIPNFSVAVANGFSSWPLATCT